MRREREMVSENIVPSVDRRQLGQSSVSNWLRPFDYTMQPFNNFFCFKEMDLCLCFLFASLLLHNVYLPPLLFVGIVSPFLALPMMFCLFLVFLSLLLFYFLFLNFNLFIQKIFSYFIIKIY